MDANERRDNLIELKFGILSINKSLRSSPVCLTDINNQYMRKYWLF